MSKCQSCDETQKSSGVTRRGFLGKLSAFLLLGGVVSQGWFALRSLSAPGIQRSVHRYKIGEPESFPEGITFVEPAKTFIIRQKNSYKALSAVCTHLGCTLKKVGNPNEADTSTIKYQCPCHRSKFANDGKNLAGPAEKPLQHLALSISPDDGQLVVDLSKSVDAAKVLFV